MLLAGLFCWTLFEYLFHRFVLHGIRWILPFHMVHHRLPTNSPFIPDWLFLTPLWGVLWFTPTQFMVGMIAGFAWYSLLHHLIHHTQWLPNMKARHTKHHRQNGNYGLTLKLWDQVFWTLR